MEKSSNAFTVYDMSKIIPNCFAYTQISWKLTV